MANDKSLENKPWYRFLKVLYGTGWILTILITIFVFYLIKPSGRIVIEKSGYTCPDGKAYVWNYTDGYYDVDDKYLNEKEI